MSPVDTLSVDAALGQSIKVIRLMTSLLLSFHYQRAVIMEWNEAPPQVHMMFFLYEHIVKSLLYPVAEKQPLFI